MSEATAPEVDETEAPEAGKAGEDFAWEDLSDETSRDEEVEVEEEPVAKPAVKKAVKEVAEEVTPAEEPEAEEVEGTEDETSEEEETLEEVTQAPAVVPPTPEEVAAKQKEYSEWRAKREATLRKEYELDEETAERFRTEPETVIPELAARIRLDIVQDVMEQLPATIRQEVGLHTKVSEREAKAEKLFFSVNPGLRAVDQKLIVEVGALWRSKNPKASPQDAAVGIGKAVAALTGVDAGAKAEVVKKLKAPTKVYKAPTSSGATPKLKPKESGDNPWSELADFDE